jgi:hypothetical protein
MSVMTEYELFDQEGNVLDAHQLKTDGTQYPMTLVSVGWHTTKVSVLLMRYVVDTSQGLKRTKVVQINPAGETNTNG